MSSSPSTSDGRSAELTLEGLTVRVPFRATPVLHDVSLKIAPPTVGGLLGPSGSGKTTLLHTVAGLIPWLRPGAVDGLIELDGESVSDLDPGQRAHLLASCLDRARAQLFLATPRHEVTAARRLYGEAPLLDAAIDGLALGPLMDRKINELSSGERQRLALAVTLAGSPRPVILDEPTAHLDDGAVNALGELLAMASRRGGGVLLAEQAGWRLGDAVSVWWEVADGALAAIGPPAPPVLPSPEHEPSDRPLLTATDLAVERDGHHLLEHIDLTLAAGEVVLISGPNGTGKSTLAEVLTGFRRPASGTVEGAVGTALMLPSAELQLFADSVEREVSIRGSREPQARVLRRHRLEHLAARAPWTLSRGERQRLVHAALDIQQPPVMVVDEPAQGLDPDELVELVRLVHRRAQRGRAYLVISHRDELATAAHRHLRVERGRLVDA